MAKKKPASGFNLSKTIRDVLTENPKLNIQETMDAVVAKHPTAKINKQTFSVAFYTSRAKLGISSPKRGKKAAKKKMGAATRPTMDLYALETAAKFLSEVGGADAALKAIKQVQALQLK